MIIEESDFRLTQVNDSSDRWDLELIHVVKARGKEPRSEFQNAGYGYSLEKAMQKIVNYRISSKHIDDAITLKDYIKEYKQQIQILKKLLNYEESK